jgi:hypothetical protein
MEFFWVEADGLSFGRCAFAVKTKPLKIKLNISSALVNKGWFFLKCLK